MWVVLWSLVGGLDQWTGLLDWHLNSLFISQDFYPIKCTELGHLFEAYQPWLLDGCQTAILRLLQQHVDSLAPERSLKVYTAATAVVSEWYWEPCGLEVQCSLLKMCALSVRSLCCCTQWPATACGCCELSMCTLSGCGKWDEFIVLMASVLCNAPYNKLCCEQCSILSWLQVMWYEEFKFECQSSNPVLKL